MLSYLCAILIAYENSILDFDYSDDVVGLLVVPFKTLMLLLLLEASKLLLLLVLHLHLLLVHLVVLGEVGVGVDKLLLVMSYSPLLLLRRKLPTHRLVRLLLLIGNVTRVRSHLLGVHLLLESFEGILGHWRLVVHMRMGLMLLLGLLGFHIHI